MDVTVRPSRGDRLPVPGLRLRAQWRPGTRQSAILSPAWDQGTEPRSDRWLSERYGWIAWCVRTSQLTITCRYPFPGSLTAAKKCVAARAGGSLAEARTVERERLLGVAVGSHCPGASPRSVEHCGLARGGSAPLDPRAFRPGMPGQWAAKYAVRPNPAAGARRG